MKYKTIIETDDFENFKFFEDGNGKYIQGIDAGAENKEWIALYFTEYKTGHWIEKDDYLYVCSECGQYIYSETEHDLLEFHAFCGRCGAKMYESQDEVKYDNNLISLRNRLCAGVCCDSCDFHNQGGCGLYDNLKTEFFNYKPTDDSE